MNWYLEVLRKYAVFSGRARRREFWMFCLINIVISILLRLIEAALGIAPANGEGFLSIIYSLAILIPSLAVGVRRLHDIGRPGWWLLIGLIPVIGLIVLLVFFIKDGQTGENQYGPSPKAVTVY